MANVSTFKYSTTRGNFWGYRFEMASEGGKRRFDEKRGFKTKAEAQKVGREALTRYEQNGRLINPSEMSVTDFLNEWLEQHNVNEVTKAGYRKKINLYITPKIGKLMLKSIRKADLNRILADLYNEGFAINTLSSIRGILTKSFEWAVDCEYLVSSPAHKLVIPTSTTPKVATRTAPHEYIAAEKMQLIFERFPFDTTNHIQLMLGYKCGLRLGEAFGLCWEDVDFQNKTISINRQVQWAKDETRTKEQIRADNGKFGFDGGYWYFTQPKFKSYRTIEIDDELVELLRKEKAEQDIAKECYGSYYVCYYADDNGKITINPEDGKLINLIAVRKAKVLSGQAQMPGSFISPRTIQYTSKVIRTELKIPEFDFHSLRHTHATMLKDSGAPPIYIQHRLGHKNVDVTLNVYANHLTPTAIQEGTAVLQQLYQPKETT